MAPSADKQHICLIIQKVFQLPEPEFFALGKVVDNLVGQGLNYVGTARPSISNFLAFSFVRIYKPMLDLRLLCASDGLED